ncbi:type VI secretion system tip protein VgrG [Corallococcus sp. CA053C]|uniref:type VI secretion system Vgr family protein n=1 Tax=Corallococcus sp. CA053C TaxID=2316732 RepID=UPI000EA1CB7D|nr:type VI secretion system tip protein VgrG [Corallococcus sp. CA053C]RKH11636.1 type VI secretion system tip protein VgrG [Corallococcus sp. CA053C]
MARTQAPAYSLQIGSHGADTLVVSRFSGTEALSRPYEFIIDFHATDGEPLTQAELINTPALLQVRVGQAAARNVHGRVFRAESLGQVGGRWCYRVWVGPQVLSLQHVRRSRLFQHQTVPEVVKTVLDEAGVELKLSLQGSYTAREYCVQYRESDLDFVRRLLEWEGIFFYFQHTEDSHTLVLGDSSGAHEPLPGGSTLPLRDDDGRAADGEYLHALQAVRRLRPGAVHLKDYDFEKPAVDTSAKAASEGVAALELYDYPGEYVAPGTGKGAAKVRMEEKAQGSHTFAGESVCPRLTPGYQFDVDSPGDGAFAGEYTVVEVVHTGLQPDTLGGAEALQGLYQNRFRLLPASVPFRPRRVTPVPRISGVQTATVVGPAGEEIHTDAHGRVKVLFHWDREGARDDKSSCWVRVGQTWGGPAWGHVYLPRIGQEVLVRFLEGNPDRPLIAGTVYNGTNPTPYALPDEKTKSTLKSASSLGSDGFNEFRIEDAASEEEIFIHAQKDKDLLTENDKAQAVVGYEDLLVKKVRVRTIEGHQTLSVSLDDASLVEGDQTLQVRGNRSTGTVADHSEEVEGNQSIVVAKTFTGTITQAAAETVGAAKALTIGGGYAVSVGLAMNEAVGGLAFRQTGAAYTELVLGSRQETIAKDKDAKVGGDWNSEVTGGATVTVGKDTGEQSKTTHLQVTEPAAWLAKTFELKADTFSIIVNGKRVIHVEKSGKVQLQAKTFTIEGSSDIKMKGSKVQMLAAAAPPSAQAEALKLAAIEGTPFCEECEKKRKSA